MIGTEVAYLAGLIDGEGCVYIGRRARTGLYHSCLTITMTDKNVLEWVKDVTGVGSVLSKKMAKRFKPAWTWQVWSDEAAKLLIKLLPYLQVKQTHANNLIAFQGVMKQPPCGSKGLSSQQKRERHAHYERSKELNKRGS